LTGTNNGCRAGKTCHNIQDVQDLSVRNDLDSTWAYVGFIVQQYAARGTCTLADSPPRRPGNTEAHATDCLYPYQFPSPKGWDPAVADCGGSQHTKINEAYWRAYHWLYTALRYVRYALKAPPEVARQMWTWGYARDAATEWDDYFSEKDTSCQYWFAEDFWYDGWYSALTGPSGENSKARLGWLLLEDALQRTFDKYMNQTFYVHCVERSCDSVDYDAWATTEGHIWFCDKHFTGANQSDPWELATDFLHESMHYETGLSDSLSTYDVCHESGLGKCYTAKDCRRLAISASRYHPPSHRFGDIQAFQNIENYVKWISTRWKDDNEYCVFPQGWKMP